jgi:hypothetical protein
VPFVDQCSGWFGRTSVGGQTKKQTSNRNSQPKQQPAKLNQTLIDRSFNTNNTTELDDIETSHVIVIEMSRGNGTP